MAPQDLAYPRLAADAVLAFLDMPVADAHDGSTILEVVSDTTQHLAKLTERVHAKIAEVTAASKAVKLDEVDAKWADTYPPPFGPLMGDSPHLKEFLISWRVHVDVDCCPTDTGDINFTMSEIRFTVGGAQHVIEFSDSDRGLDEDIKFSGSCDGIPMDTKSLIENGDVFVQFALTVLGLEIEKGQYRGGEPYTRVAPGTSISPRARTTSATCSNTRVRRASTSRTPPLLLTRSARSTPPGPEARSCSINLLSGPSLHLLTFGKLPSRMSYNCCL
jgi:hypothetical protein